MDRTVQYPHPIVKQLTIKLAYAQVEAYGDNVQQIEVLVSGDEESVQELVIRHEDERLTIEQATIKFVDKWVQGRWLQVSVRIPYEWRGDVSLGSVSGAVSLQKVAGDEIVLDTVSGPIEAKTLEMRALRANTVSGAVLIGRVSGQSAALRTISGDVRLSDAGFQTVKVASVSGNVEMAFVNPFASLDAQTLSGHVRIAMPGDKVDVGFHSISGRLSLSGFSTGAGAPKVSASSVSGNVTIGGIQ